MSDEIEQEGRAVHCRSTAIGGDRAERRSRPESSTAPGRRHRSVAGSRDGARVPSTAMIHLPSRRARGAGPWLREAP